MDMPGFKEAAETLETSSSTIIRRFNTPVTQLPPGVQLPKAIAINGYKADTDTHKSVDILPNRHKDTIQDCLKQYGTQVEIVVMDMNPSFKAAVKKALNRPVIVADRFHYCRSIHWAADEVQRKVQREWHDMTARK